MRCGLCAFFFPLDHKTTYNFEFFFGTNGFISRFVANASCKCVARCFIFFWWTYFSVSLYQLHQDIYLNVYASMFLDASFYLMFNRINARTLYLRLLLQHSSITFQYLTHYFFFNHRPSENQTQKNCAFEKKNNISLWASSMLNGFTRPFFIKCQPTAECSNENWLLDDSTKQNWFISQQDFVVICSICIFSYFNPTEIPFYLIKWFDTMFQFTFIWKTML